MREQTIAVRQSMGRILCSTIFSVGGEKLMAKGHVITPKDAQTLQTEGMEEIWVAELEDGEVGEDEAVMQVAKGIVCGSVDIRPAAGGRANIFATEPSCVLVDDELLKQINCTDGIAIATATNFSYAQIGKRIATIKSIPFGVAKSQIETILSIVMKSGPVLQSRPIRTPTVGVLYVNPTNGQQARPLFENIMAQRLQRLDAGTTYALSSTEEEGATARALEHLIFAKPTAILVASMTAPAGPQDIVGRAMVRVGCQIERFLAPVVPGNLLLMGYKDDIPIVSAPGCFRSAKLNVLDLILPPMLARYRISGWEVGYLGHGGLLA